MGYKFIFLDTWDECKSVKLEFIYYLLSTGFISSQNGDNFRYLKSEVI